MPLESRPQLTEMSRRNGYFEKWCFHKNLWIICMGFVQFITLPTKQFDIRVTLEYLVQTFASKPNWTAILYYHVVSVTTEGLSIGNRIYWTFTLLPINNYDSLTDLHTPKSKSSLLCGWGFTAGQAPWDSRGGPSGKVGRSEYAE
jgi:hypothetical protein